MQATLTCYTLGFAPSGNFLNPATVLTVKTTQRRNIMNFNITQSGTGYALEHNGRLLRLVQFKGYDPFNTGSDLYYIVEEELYPARTLLTHLLKHEFSDPPPPLPPAVPWPDTQSILPVDVRALLLRAAEGYDTPPDMTQDQLRDAGVLLKVADITCLPPTRCTEMILDIRNAALEQRRKVLGEGDEPRGSKLSAINTRPRMHVDDYAIREATTEEMDTTVTYRRQWPFVKMNVGQTVVIPANEAAAGQSAAHAIGSIKKWKFRTRRAGHTGEMIVTRVK